MLVFPLLLAACGDEGRASPTLEVVEISDDVLSLRFDHQGTEIYRIEAFSATRLESTRRFESTRLVFFLAGSDPELTVGDGVTFEREDSEDFTMLTIRSNIFTLSNNYGVSVWSARLEESVYFRADATDYREDKRSGTGPDLVRCFGELVSAVPNRSPSKVISSEKMRDCPQAPRREL